jgi:hypothetical protein
MWLMLLLYSVTNETRKQGKRVRDEHGIRVNKAVGKNLSGHFGETTVAGQVIVPSFGLATHRIPAQRDSREPKRHEIQPSQKEKREAYPI